MGPKWYLSQEYFSLFSKIEHYIVSPTCEQKPDKLFIILEQKFVEVLSFLLQRVRRAKNRFGLFQSGKWHFQPCATDVYDHANVDIHLHSFKSKIQTLSSRVWNFLSKIFNKFGKFFRQKMNFFCCHLKKGIRRILEIFIFGEEEEEIRFVPQTIFLTLSSCIRPWNNVHLSLSLSLSLLHATLSICYFIVRTHTIYFSSLPTISLFHLH